MTLTPITVTLHETDAHGNPARGSYWFRLDTPIIDTSSGTTVAATDQIATLDSSGNASIVLTATDDPTTTPVGAAYRVVERLKGGVGARTFYIQVPHTAPSGTATLNSLIVDYPGLPTFPVKGDKGDTGLQGPVGPSGDIFVVNDYTALRGLTAGEYAHVQVKGTSTALNGTAGVFYWDSASTATDDGGVWIKPSGVSGGSPGRWVRVFSGPVDPHWHGAKGDGSTNDYGAVNAAIQAAALTTGMMAGRPVTYRVDQFITIPSNVSISGAGLGKTVFDFSNMPFGQGGAQDACFATQGSIGSAISTIATVAFGSRTITFTNPGAGLPAANDVIVITNQTPASWTNAQDRQLSSMAGEWARVHHIVDNGDGTQTATLFAPLYDSYTAGSNIVVYKPTMPTFHAEGFSIIAPNANSIGRLSTQAWEVFGLRVTFCKAVRITGVDIRGSTNSNMAIENCYDVVIDGQKTNDYNIPHTVEVGTNYGIGLQNSQMVTVTGCHLQSYRHAISTGGATNPVGGPVTVAVVPTRNVRISNSVLGSQYISGGYAVGLHDNTEWVTVENCTLLSGIGFGGDHTAIRNCVICTDANGCAVYGSDDSLGANLTVENCDIVQTAPINTSSVAPTGISVPAMIRFIGAKGFSLWLTIATSQIGSGSQNEKQTLTMGAAPSGSFTLTFGGQTTAPIAYNANAAAVQSALQALSSIGAGNVTVTGGPFPNATMTVEFVGALALTNVAQMTGSTYWYSGPVLRRSGGTISIKHVKFHMHNMTMVYGIYLQNVAGNMDNNIDIDDVEFLGTIPNADGNSDFAVMVTSSPDSVDTLSGLSITTGWNKVRIRRVSCNGRGIRVDNAVRDLEITDCFIENACERGISVLTVATFGSSTQGQNMRTARIERNTIIAAWQAGMLLFFDPILMKCHAMLKGNYVVNCGRGVVGSTANYVEVFASAADVIWLEDNRMGQTDATVGNVLGNYGFANVRTIYDRRNDLLGSVVNVTRAATASTSPTKGAVQFDSGSANNYGAWVFEGMRAGAPAFDAAIGSRYYQSDGTATHTLWIKELTGTGAGAWANK